MPVLRVKEPHSFDLGGVPVTMRRGQLVESDDPRVKGREQHYEPAEDAAARETGGPASDAIETATAGPGDRRSRSRPRREHSSTT